VGIREPGTPPRLPGVRWMTLWLDQPALEVIERRARERPFLETGGALFGYEETDDVAVAFAFGPGRHAKHRPRSFEPHEPTTAGLMGLVREASGARYRFLGSWHTHTRGLAVPSSVDNATASRMSEQSDLLLPEPVVVIQAIDSARQKPALRELRAWRWADAIQRLREIDVQVCELDERFLPDATKLAKLGLD
jgi:proteasome lid subunit RPN8/RPN11